MALTAAHVFIQFEKWMTPDQVDIHVGRSNLSNGLFLNYHNTCV